jgi:glycine/D-amino acid oxidase-like deaminating enzyme
MSAPERVLDFLIVGQGLAGSFLARALIERGRTVLVVDDDQRDSSSRVAAGLLNPITGMRLRLTEGTGELLCTSRSFFAKLAREHRREVFTDMPIRRLYASEKEQMLKTRRAIEPEYAALMSADDAPRTVNSAATALALADPLGSFLIGGGGWVDLPLLLDLESAWLRAHGALESGVVRFEELSPDGSGGARWRGFHARRGVVFCNGYKAGLEPCWNWIPWQPARGELIDCETAVETAPWILNRSGWAIPLGGGRWRSGSTWEWDAAKFDEPPLPRHAEDLRIRLQGFFQTPLHSSIVRHRAGVRPCVFGNQPFFGTHPQLGWLHLFGGLGPKGTFWGPSCAAWLADSLCDGAPPPARFDVRRVWRE